MNLDYLRYFLKLAETRHYTKAAEQLCIAQPSLSHAIRQLESELGVPLFEKKGRNTSLTRFGEEFLSCAQRTLSTLDEGVLALQRYAKGGGADPSGISARPGDILYPADGSPFSERKPGTKSAIFLSYREDTDTPGGTGRREI